MQVVLLDLPVPDTLLRGRQRQSAAGIFRKKSLGEEALGEGELRKRKAHGENDEHEPG